MQRNRKKRVYDRAALEKLKAQIPVSVYLAHKLALRVVPERNVMCPLPEHTETKGSFRIDRGDDFWGCFGCGEQGDVFSLHMLLTGESFGKAVREISRMAGSRIELVQKDGGELELFDPNMRRFERALQRIGGESWKRTRIMIEEMERTITDAYLARRFDLVDPTWLDAYMDIEVYPECERLSLTCHTRRLKIDNPRLWGSYPVSQMRSAEVVKWHGIVLGRIAEKWR